MRKDIKLLIVICSIIGVASAGMAGNIAVNYSAAAGFYFNATPASGILGSGESTLVQLIYSVDSTADDVTIGGGVSGDDVLWASFIVNETDTSEWADFSAPTLNTTHSTGYIYARIFQDNTIDNGDWYYYSTPQLLVDSTPPQGIQMNTDLINGNAIDVGATTGQVVPEPATAMLLALGGGLAWLVRMKQRVG